MGCVFMQDHKFGAYGAGDVLAHWNLKVLVECFISKAVEACWKTPIGSVICGISSGFVGFVLLPSCNTKK